MVSMGIGVYPADGAEAETALGLNATTADYRPCHQVKGGADCIPNHKRSALTLARNRAACSRGGLPSRQAEVLQRSASGPATDIRLDDEFKYLSVVEVHLILFNLACRFGWTEIPLLANNLVKCAPAIRRPPQNELLCTPNFVFLKNKGYAFEPLRLIEDQTNRLVPRRCRPPASRIFGTEGRFDRKILVFRRNLDHGRTLQV
jgi:hypothetical protein